METNENLENKNNEDEIGNSKETIEETSENEGENAQGSEVIQEKEDETGKLKELEDKLLRTYAEYDNFRKRTQKEKEAMFGDGQIAAICEFLPILDNLERAMGVEVQSEDAKNLAQGVLMVVNQFKDTLIKLNITPIETDNQEFDPEKHNAVMHIDDDNYGQNVIVEELMKGYLYKDKVIRHSMVKVAN